MQVNLATKKVRDGQAVMEPLKAGQQTRPAGPQDLGNGDVLAIAQDLWDSACDESRTLADDEQAAVGLEPNKNHLN